MNIFDKKYQLLFVLEIQFARSVEQYFLVYFVFQNILVSHLLSFQHLYFLVPLSSPW